MRADARRNYDKVLMAARQAFAEGGTATSLEEIARRAGVGIGTLYRHFPTRQQLLEAVYVDEVEALASSTAELQQLPPWEALVGWVDRLQRYMVTKQALAQELLEFIDRGAASCSASAAGRFTTRGGRSSSEPRPNTFCARTSRSRRSSRSCSGSRRSRPTNRASSIASSRSRSTGFVTAPRRDSVGSRRPVPPGPFWREPLRTLG